MKRTALRRQSDKQRQRTRELGELGAHIIVYGQINKCEVPQCQYRATYLRLDSHHILERSRGGKDNAGNLLLCCRGCHDTFKTLSPVISDEQAFKIAHERNLKAGIPDDLTGAMLREQRHSTLTN